MIFITVHYILVSYRFQNLPLDFNFRCQPDIKNTLQTLCIQLFPHISSHFSLPVCQIFPRTFLSTYDDNSGMHLGFTYPVTQCVINCSSPFYNTHIEKSHFNNYRLIAVNFCTVGRELFVSNFDNCGNN